MSFRMSGDMSLQPCSTANAEGNAANRTLMLAGLRQSFIDLHSRLTRRRITCHCSSRNRRAAASLQWEFVSRRVPRGAFGAT